MTLPLILHPAAQAEFDGSIAWYDSQKPGLGDDFIIQVKKTLDIIANQPARYAIVKWDIRAANVPVFPYYIYYRVEQNQITVISVFHSSRDPSIWQGRK